jgi:hypothetical protein
MEFMKNYNFKGLHLTFNPETRNFTKEVWLDIGKKASITVD